MWTSKFPYYFYQNLSYYAKLSSSDSKFESFSKGISVINYYLVSESDFYEKENICRRY